MNNIGQCRLCGKNAQLHSSHIFPKFLVRWMKDTGTGYLRGGNNFNIRHQDGPKSSLLCSECEDRFSKLETYFASKIFYPIVDGGAEQFHYDERLFKFVASIFWRLLQNSLLDEDRSDYFQRQVMALEREWRTYLLSDSSDLVYDKLHLLVGVDVMRVSDGIDVSVPDIFIQYMARSLDGGVTDDNIDYSIGFVKLPRFFFLIPVCGFDDNKMFNTRILHSGGTYSARDARIEDETVAHLLLQRAGQSQQAKDSMSPTQRQKMREISEERLDRYNTKDLGDIMRYTQDKEDRT